MTIEPTLINPNHQLDKCADALITATKRAADYVNTHLLPTKNVSVVYTDAMYTTIPELGFSGWTYSDDLVIFNVSPDDRIDEDALFLHVCHELAHATRWQKNNEWSDNLIKSMLFEGMAVSFSKQAAADRNVEPDFFLRKMMSYGDGDNKAILQRLSPLLFSNQYDRSELFVNGNTEKCLPRWAAYSAGFYLINTYLSLSKKTPAEIVDEKYQAIIDLLASNGVIDAPSAGK